MCLVYHRRYIRFIFTCSWRIRSHEAFRYLSQSTVLHFLFIILSYFLSIHLMECMLCSHDTTAMKLLYITLLPHESWLPLNKSCSNSRIYLLIVHCVGEAEQTACSNSLFSSLLMLSELVIYVADIIMCMH